MWHPTTYKISVSLSYLNWIKNEMIFYCISELMFLCIYRLRTLYNLGYSKTSMTQTKMTHLPRLICVLESLRNSLDGSKQIFRDIYGKFLILSWKCLLCVLIRVASLMQNSNQYTQYTLQPLYNTVRYNTVLDITRLKDGSKNV